MATSATAQKIAEAGRHLLDQEGAEAVTMRRVASAVGITPMAVYRHYANHQDLLSALAEAGFAELAARLTQLRSTGDFNQRLKKMLNVYLNHALENPRLFELMFLKERQSARCFPEDFKAGHSPTATPMAALIKDGMESGYLQSEDPWEVTFAIGALLQGLLMLYLGGRINMAEPRFRAFCHRSLLRHINGIRA